MGRATSPERTHENQLIEKATKELFKATDPIVKLRNLCLQRGVDGIIGFGQMFRRMDKNRNGKLTKEEFSLGMKETGLDIPTQEVTELFKKFDKDNNGTVNYDEFLAAIRPPLNESCIEVINWAFDKMDRTNDGIATIEDLKLAYNVKFHPSFLNGVLSEEEVLKNYLAKFEKNGSIDGVLTREEFTDYYAGVSSSIDSDVYFIILVKSSWKL